MIKKLKLKSAQSFNGAIGWGAKTAVWGTILLYLISQLAVVIVVSLATFIFGSEIDLEKVSTVSIIQIVSAGLMFTGLLVILKRRDLGLSSLGFRKINIRLFAWSIGLFIVYLILSAALISLASFIPGFDESQTQDVGFSSPRGIEILAAFLVLVIIPPLIEEMVFRGFLYRGLSRGWISKTVIFGGIFLAIITTLLSQNIFAGLMILLITGLSVAISKRNYKIAAAIFTSSVFGLAHAQWNVAIDTFALSMVLIYLYEKTNNLWACVFLHGFKNLTAFIILFVIN